MLGSAPGPPSPRPGRPPHPRPMNALASPPILFFLIGMLSRLLRTGLSVPRPVTKLLSLYLLFAIGFKGGLGLAQGGLTAQVGATLLAAVALASVTPVFCYAVLRLRLSATDAGAVAACYGSISAITFITASAVLREQGVAYSGHMVAAMALMESPAIVVGVLLARLNTREEGPVRWGRLLHESFLNGPVFLLMGSMAVGWLTGPGGDEQLKPFLEGIFTGVLCFFLLDLGVLAARRLRDLTRAGWFCVAFALVVPVVNAALGAATARALGLGLGDAFLLTMLAGSASYIAVPAAVRLVLPSANAGIYIPMTLAVTFPFNVLVAIPLYLTLMRAWWGP